MVDVGKSCHLICYVPKLFMLNIQTGLKTGQLCVRVGQGNGDNPNQKLM